MLDFVLFGSPVLFDHDGAVRRSPKHPRANRGFLTPSGIPRSLKFGSRGSKVSKIATKLKKVYTYDGIKKSLAFHVERYVLDDDTVGVCLSYEGPQRTKFRLVQFWT